MTYQRITRRRSPQSIPALCIGLVTLLMFGEAASAQRLHLSAAEQQRLRELVEKDDEAAALFEQVRQAADAALQQPPRPLREIHYEGLLDTDPRRVDTQKSLDSIDSTEPLMWAWIVTGDEACADHAAAHVLAWAEKYEPTGNPINENKFEPLWLRSTCSRAATANSSAGRSSTGSMRWPGRRSRASSGGSGRSGTTGTPSG